MATQEIYVRGANDTEARGPFTIEQLITLVEAGQVTAETYFYDSTTEQWILIGSSAAMKAQLWPEKKKMGFKQKDFKSVTQIPEDSAPPISVQDFLAAAEGKTDDTKDKSNKADSMMNAAVWGTRSAAIICLLSAVALILPGIDALTSMDFAKIMEKPFVLLGVVDALLGILLLLGVITLYPFVRFRAVLGLGFLGFLFLAQGQLTPIIAVAAGSVGLYFCTIFLSYVPLTVAALAGVVGMVMLATTSYS
ncbi:GYF domain-containing protein [Oleiharenicola lentus]|uniref:GYF domain-containing protein n=1 Tax=Oleiharenicola lentus TaxID=2508720 RepID=UPI003F66C933